MTNAAPLSLALVALVLAACSGDPDLAPEGDEGAPAPEEPVGIAEGALGTGNALYFSAQVSFGGPLYLYGADTPDLGAQDNVARAVKNSTSGPVTLWTGRYYTGRCEVVPSNTGYWDLTYHDIGAARLSSIQFGDHCHNNPNGVVVENHTDRDITLNYVSNADASKEGRIDLPYGGAVELPISANAWEAEIHFVYTDVGTNLSSWRKIAGEGFAAVPHIVFSNTDNRMYIDEFLP
jgi:hypothetical protein